MLNMIQYCVLCTAAYIALLAVTILNATRARTQVHHRLTMRAGEAPISAEPISCSSLLDFNADSSGQASPVLYVCNVQDYSQAANELSRQV